MINEYEIKEYKKPDPKEMEPIANGIKAPKFTGFHFQLKDSISLNDYKNKYVLIDFWYRDCFPCIEAISSLNKLRTKYSKNDLVILGLNPYDNKVEDEEKLKDFIEINKMNYPTIFVDFNVTRNYNVRSFPTFYIIDKSGNIVYSQIGYGEKYEKEIDSILNKWIK